MLCTDVSDKTTWSLDDTHSGCFAPTEIMMVFQGHSHMRGSVWMWWSASLQLWPLPYSPLPTHTHTHLSPSVLFQCQDIKQPCTCLFHLSHIERLFVCEHRHTSIAGLFLCNPTTQQPSNATMFFFILCHCSHLLFFLLFFSFPFFLPMSERCNNVAWDLPGFMSLEFFATGVGLKNSVTPAFLTFTIKVTCVETEVDDWGGLY